MFLLPHMIFVICLSVCLSVCLFVCLFFRTNEINTQGFVNTFMGMIHQKSFFTLRFFFRQFFDPQIFFEFDFFFEKKLFTPTFFFLFLIFFSKIRNLKKKKSNFFCSKIFVSENLEFVHSSGRSAERHYSSR